MMGSRMLHLGLALRSASETRFCFARSRRVAGSRAGPTAAFFVGLPGLPGRACLALGWGLRVTVCAWCLCVCICVWVGPL